MTKPTFRPDRRQMLTGGAVAVGALAGAAGIWAAVRTGAGPRAKAADEALLTILSDITIPATDTPGAVAAGVPAFVILAVDHGLKGAPPDLVAQLEAVLDKAAGRRFRNLARADQVAVLTKVDAATVGAKPTSPWATVKALILGGYYTSEVGASKELQYDLAPGRLDVKVPVGDDTRAYSTDPNARSGPSS